MRHADSEETRTVRDHDRPITELGRRTSADVAAQLRTESWVPDVLVCSNALRSRQTLAEMRRELDVDHADEHYLGSLYTLSQTDGQTRSHLQVRFNSSESRGINKGATVATPQARMRNSDGVAARLLARHQQAADSAIF